jgi:hypothetical protein
LKKIYNSTTFPAHSADACKRGQTSRLVIAEVRWNRAAGAGASE